MNYFLCLIGFGYFCVGPQHGSMDEIMPCDVLRRWDAATTISIHQHVCVVVCSWSGAVSRGMALARFAVVVSS